MALQREEGIEQQVVAEEEEKKQEEEEEEEEEEQVPSSQATLIMEAGGEVLEDERQSEHQQSRVHETERGEEGGDEAKVAKKQTFEGMSKEGEEEEKEEDEEEVYARPILATKANKEAKEWEEHRKRNCKRLRSSSFTAASQAQLQKA
jgi:hypothetical protein